MDKGVIIILKSGYEINALDAKVENIFENMSVNAGACLTIEGGGFIMCSEIAAVLKRK